MSAVRLTFEACRNAIYDGLACTPRTCAHTHTQKNNGPVVLQSISQGVTVDTAISLTEPEQLHSSPQIYKHTDPHTHSSLIADSSARDGWLCVCGPRGECCTLVRVSLGQISHKRSKAVTVPERYTFYHIQQLQTLFTLGEVGTFCMLSYLQYLMISTISRVLTLSHYSIAFELI